MPPLRPRNLLSRPKMLDNYFREDSMVVEAKRKEGDPMHTIRRYLRSYRYYRAAAAVIFLLFLLHSAILSLIFYFSGSDTISERLSETIPLEAGFQNSNYFGKNYHGASSAEPEKVIPFLKQTVSTLEALADDPGVAYCNYQIGMQFYLDRVFPNGVPRRTVTDWASAAEMPEDDETSIRGNEWEDTGLRLVGLSGIRTKDFFAHNNIALLESADAPLTEESAYVPHSTVVRDEDGTYRPVRLGDQIEIYDYNVAEPYRLHTCVVEGIYQYFSKFDYSYGKDPTFIDLGSVFVSDTLMLDLTQRSYARNADDPENIAKIGVASMVIQTSTPRAYEELRADMSTAAQALDAWCAQNDVPPAGLAIYEPRYLKMADSIQETASLYRAIFLAVDAMLLLLIGGLSWYLISRKKKELFVFYSIGMKKRQIAGHYCGYYVLLVLPAAILGAMLGYYLNLLLSIKIARDTVALQEELLRFSNNGQAVARSIDAAIRDYDVGPAAILGGGAVTVAVTAAVTAGIVLLALAVLLRRQPREFVRGEGL